MTNLPLAEPLPAHSFFREALHRGLKPSPATNVLTSLWRRIARTAGVAFRPGVLSQDHLKRNHSMVYSRNLFDPWSSPARF
jgi:hypothetical protein